MTIDDAEEALKILSAIKYAFTLNPEPFNDDFDHGYYNGLEVAIAAMENRPPLYLTKDKKYHENDKAMYPEYFI
jgi:hypothetical protein